MTTMPVTGLQESLNIHVLHSRVANVRFLTPGWSVWAGLTSLGAVDRKGKTDYIRTRAFVPDDHFHYDARVGFAFDFQLAASSGLVADHISRFIER
jgi:hypothetical protein